MITESNEHRVLPTGLLSIHTHQSGFPRSSVLVCVQFVFLFEGKESYMLHICGWFHQFSPRGETKDGNGRFV